MSRCAIFSCVPCNASPDIAMVNTLVEAYLAALQLETDARRPRRRHQPRQYWQHALRAVELAGLRKESLREVERYTRAADQARLARNAMARTSKNVTAVVTKSSAC
jgi:hypothetical protein